ncbi:MAG: hypothetical protein KAY59_03825 [Acidobacteria bacterium]|nr:hypothetical protein [Acidobacteriota bacterium]
MTIDEESTYRSFVAEKLVTILAEVQKTNGRVREAEIAIAVLKVGYAVGAIVFAACFAWLLQRLP